MAAKKAKSKAAILSTPKKGAGQPAHVPTSHSQNLVKVCCAIGYSQEQTAGVVGISVPTLQKHYAVELERGAAEINARIAGNIAVIATDKNHPRAVTAAIWWTKCRMGWADMTVVPNGGESGEEDEAGGPVPLSFTLKIGEKTGGANG